MSGGGEVLETQEQHRTIQKRRVATFARVLIAETVLPTARIVMRGCRKIMASDVAGPDLADAIVQVPYDGIDPDFCHQRVIGRLSSRPRSTCNG